MNRSPRFRTSRTLACAAALLCGAQGLSAQSTAPAAPTAGGDAPATAVLPPVQVRGHYDNDIGTSDAASEGAVTQRLIQNRPALRPGEILEFVPGMIVTQHSGNGKANQYFLRGFNLDHGTDFATFVDGMPVNMVTHAHGQGYTDLGFLIPELVRRIDYRKGPYFAREGDFASAGSARLALLDTLPRPLAEITLGQRDYRRGLFAGSTQLGESGVSLLGAVEAQTHNGPWKVPEDQRKFNGWLRATQRDGNSDRALTFMAYDARWTSTDQIPAALVENGTLDRFGSLDPSDGGRSRRISLSGSTRTTLNDGAWQASAYAVSSKLNLFSNFTYFLDDPVNGDQFEQAERRRMFGGELSRVWDVTLGGREHAFTLGLQARHDRLDPVGLYRNRARDRLATTVEAEVKQTQAGVYGEWNARWTPWLRSIAGLRADAARFDVDSSVAGNSGKASDEQLSPKLGLVFGPWQQTEFFVNAGRGFHSNDARGTTARFSPDGTESLDPVPGLAASRGTELGLRTVIVPGLQSSFAVWRLDLDSELVYIGDAGTTEPSGASRRSGVEWNNHWVLDDVGLPGWLLDLDLAASRARFRDAPSGSDRVPGSVDRVASFGIGYAPEGGRWFGHFQVRHFGPRDLVEDGSEQSSATTLAYLRGGWRPTASLTLAIDVFNLFDREASDIDYFYDSRPIQGGPAAEDRHFHPVEPRTLRVTASYRF
ncbi:MAG: TonB-dependent receptor [Methylibium sp.]|uniref:TonB-dependent receptor n=1 Tax=Methylibium sp. TaxID=2067992 RepID=UPI0017F76827|nr:TonB-dependent receptor [Methylibium sp.]MBA3598900.1 TonB-dependent receptor [Methylibium sp.]